MAGIIWYQVGSRMPDSIWPHGTGRWMLAGWIGFTLVGVALILIRRNKTPGEPSTSRPIKDQREKLIKLQEISAAFSSTMPKAEIIHMIVDYAHDLTNAFFVTVSEVDWKRDQIRTLSTTATNKALIKKGLGLLKIDLSKPYALSGARERFEKGEISVVNDATELSGDLFPKGLMAQVQKLVGIETVVETPLMVGGDAYGVMVFAFRHKIIDLDLLKMFAGHCAQALIRADRMEGLYKEGKHLSKIIDEFADGVLRADSDGRIIDGNRGAQRLSGFSLDELKGKYIDEIILCREPCTQKVKENSSGSNYENFEALVVQPDGHGTRINATMTVLPGSEGEAAGFTVTFRDIEKEKQIRSEINLLAKIVEQSPNSVVLTNFTGEITYANTTATAYSGYSNDELIGRQISDILSNEDVKYLGIFESLQRGEAFAGEVMQVKKNGRKFPSVLKGFVLEDEESKVTSFAFLSVDLTTQKRSEIEIAAKNTELGRTSSELAKSNVDLRRMSEVKMNFLSIASHELKTPLTSIKGYSDIMVENFKDQMTPSIYKMMQTVSRSANRLHKIINDILDMSRIEQKRLKLSLSKVNLGEVLKETMEEIEPLALQREIVMRAEIDGGIPQIYVDRFRIQQVFTNLMSNAVKFSPNNKEMRVVISKENGNVHLKFIDQGIGVQEVEKERIFDPFYEAGDIKKHSTGSTKFLGGGTGLGLSIAKGIISIHGGKIWVDSNNEEAVEFPGSCFHVVLPVKPHVSEFARVDGSIPGNFVKDDTSSLNDKRTLLVGDANRETMVSVLKIFGDVFNVVAAGTAGECVEKAYRLRPSVILLDIDVKGLTGLEVCRILKSQPETSRIPIIIMSSEINEQEIEQCYEAGANEYVMRPLEDKEILQKIWQLLLLNKSSAHLPFDH